jgi:serine/threonine-protein kinase RsbW
MEAERLDDGRLVIRCVLDSTAEAVRQVLRDVRRQLDGQFSAQPADATWEIVVAEVLNNIVEHAYATRPGGEIRVVLAFAAETLEADFVDFGRAMPRCTVPSGAAADLDVPRDALPEGGFGWFLIRTLCSRLDYAHTEGENRLHLEIPLAQQG